MNSEIGEAADAATPDNMRERAPRSRKMRMGQAERVADARKRAVETKNGASDAGAGGTPGETN